MWVAFTLVFEVLVPAPQLAEPAGTGKGRMEELRDVRAEARAKARADYARRHRGDSTRLRALESS
jgi:hypothetical protein